jgi:hypothetical protein
MVQRTNVARGHQPPLQQRTSKIHPAANRMAKKAVQSLQSLQLE